MVQRVSTVAFERIEARAVDMQAQLASSRWLKRVAMSKFKHPTKTGRVTVPHPERDIPVGTLKSIERQSGLKLR